MSLKLVYVTLYPEKYPRVKKISTTLEDQNITFQALAPKIIKFVPLIHTAKDFEATMKI